MTIYLISHAEADLLGAWSLSADALRPLTEAGYGQAMTLVHTMHDAQLQVILTSPTVRCVSTALPVAIAHSIDLRTRHELLQSSTASPLVGQLLGADTDALLCTDSDVIRHTLADLKQHHGSRHVETPPAGSIYVLNRKSDGVQIDYIPPPIPTQRPHRTGVVLGGGGRH